MAELVPVLRAVLALFELHPALPAPYVVCSSYRPARAYVTDLRALEEWRAVVGVAPEEVRWDTSIGSKAALCFSVDVDGATVEFTATFRLAADDVRRAA
ncbi:hypothetical protein RKE29_00900 [Streptomyces sp. B1866]|uniref:hypothetical protein n=1 Tax=Streptomyces sp. B1866 TaxID=3075431 RepID=UPI00288D1D3B|nr:hypothetical protein [Streptomyces sp. B1866]MDT3395221.1 hypothetical protein [Streptomyces sp. B1866]